VKSFIAISCIILTVITASVLLNACRKNKTSRPDVLAFTIPNGFPETVYNFSANPLTKEGVALGRKLFHEDKLSKDGNFPCSSCHEQDAAFTTYEHDRSHGYNFSHTLRNAPALSNLAWYPVLNQDGSGTGLETISVAHITSPTDMGETMSGVISKLSADAQYRQLFRSAYGDENITGERISNALKQFLLTMVSANSKYDKVKKGQASFSVYEEMGYEVFKAKCNSCHTEPLFTDFSYRNIGLPINPSLPDFGRMRVTGNKADSLKFRVPSLRNVEFSSYYTHDGRFSAIQNVIQHYRSGVQQSATLDPALTNGISLSNTDVINLVAFLKTLSDSTYIKDAQFSKP
jgi:cytochrome c peroxidase